MSKNTVKLDQAAIVATTDDDLAKVPSIEGLSAKQVRAICRIAAAQDVVIANASDIVEWAQGLVDRDVAEGRRSEGFSLKSVSSAGRHVLNRMSAEREARKAEVAARQQVEPMTERQDARATQLATWVMNEIDTESLSTIVARAHAQVCDQAMAVLFPPVAEDGTVTQVTKAQASAVISNVLRFATVAGLEAPGSVFAPSAEGEAVATVEGDSSSEEESAF